MQDTGKCVDRLQRCMGACTESTRGALPRDACSAMAWLVHGYWSYTSLQHTVAASTPHSMSCCAAMWLEVSAASSHAAAHPSVALLLTPRTAPSSGPHAASLHGGARVCVPAWRGGPGARLGVPSKAPPWQSHRSHTRGTGVPGAPRAMGRSLLVKLLLVLRRGSWTALNVLLVIRMAMVQTKQQFVRAYNVVAEEAVDCTDGRRGSGCWEPCSSWLGLGASGSKRGTRGLGVRSRPSSGSMTAGGGSSVAWARP